MERISLSQATPRRIREAVEVVEAKVKANKLEPLTAIVDDVAWQVLRIHSIASCLDLPPAALRPNGVWRRDSTPDETTADTTIIELRTPDQGEPYLIVHRRKAAEHTPRASLVLNLPTTRGEVRHV